MHSLNNEFWMVMTGVALLMAGTILFFTIYSERFKRRPSHQAGECARCGHDVQLGVDNCSVCGQAVSKTPTELQQKHA